MRDHTWSVLLWALAVVITIVLAAFQRMTGPSWPLHGTAEIGGRRFQFRLPRSHGGQGDLPVFLAVPEDVAGKLVWRRYPTGEEWRELAMQHQAGRLTGAVPHQSPAGKVEYRLVLERSTERVALPPTGAVVARFRGAVPAGVLVPHILAMFLSMLLSTRALLESLRPRSTGARTAVVATMALLVVGGLFLGPLVQKHAFGAYWTGWPVGNDLTDSKTLAAVVAWLPATVAALTRRQARLAVVLGWLVMMAVFLVPHSLYGSQLDWADVPASAAAPR